MNKNIRVLVTGAGSGVGQGIIKSLKLSKLPLHIISADIAAVNAGLYRTDEALIIPKVEEDDALQRMADALYKSKPDMVFVGSEFEMLFFAKNRDFLERECKTHIIVAAEEAIEMANDKWFTVCCLQKNGLPYPLSALGEAGKPPFTEVASAIGYPCVLKTRTGTSGRHVNIVHSKEELERLWPSVPNPMVQELLVEPSTQLKLEYTCSVFRCADGTLLGPFTARRTLRGGNSWIVEVEPFIELHPFLLTLGSALDFSGSLNVQLILTQRGPVPFELNMRFSGTTAVRAHFGFNEPEIYIRSYFLKEQIKQPEIRKGMAFRYLEEVFVDGYTLNEINTNHFPKGEVRQWF